MSRLLRALGWSREEPLPGDPDTEPGIPTTPRTTDRSTPSATPAVEVVLTTSPAGSTTPTSTIHAPHAPHQPPGPPGHDTEGTHTMADYESIIEAIQNDVTGFIGATIVDLDSGMSLSSRSAVANFDLDVASAYNSEMVKGKFKTMKALGLDSELEDMLLTLSDQLHLIKVMDGGTTFLYVAATKANTNLALLRRAVNQHTVGH